MSKRSVADGVFAVCSGRTRWLSSGFDGGFSDGPCAYNISVPEGWNRTDLDRYAVSRRRAAGFQDDGPTLFTGVDLEHLRGARSEPVEVYATAGVSNPAALPMDPAETDSAESAGEERGDVGTINLIVVTDRALEDGALTNLLGVVVEAKAATLFAETGFPGTTTDAVVVGSDPTGESVPFSGSATDVGAAARACTRDAVRASLHSRYPDREFPATVADAEYGVRTTSSSEVFEI